MRLIDKNTKFFIEVYAQVQIINQNNVNLAELFNIYDSIISSESCYCIAQLAVNGDDLIKLGYVGKNIKQKLDELLNLVIENKLLNDKSTLIEYLKNHG